MFKNFYRRLPLLILSPMFCRCRANVLPFLPMWYRCAAVPVPIPENRKICCDLVLLRRARSVRCDSAFRVGFRWLPSLLDVAQNISYWVYEYSLGLRLTFAMSASDARRLMVHADPSSYSHICCFPECRHGSFNGQAHKVKFWTVAWDPKSCLHAQWTRPIHIRWNSKWEQGSAW